MDILNSQIFLIYLIITLFAIDARYIVIIFTATAIASFLKLIDKYMKQTNCEYHFDIFFLFNLVFLHNTFQETENGIIIYKIFITASIWMFSIVEFYAYEMNKESREFVFVHITGVLFVLTTFIKWWCGLKVDLAFLVVSQLLKFSYIVHLYYYKKPSGFYNDFLVQLGGGEHVMQKNIGYHMINYQMKIILLSFIICPLYLTNVPIVVLIIMFGFAATSMWFYVVVQDAYFIHRTRQNTSLEEEAILRDEIDAKI